MIYTDYDYTSEGIYKNEKIILNESSYTEKRFQNLAETRKVFFFEEVKFEKVKRYF